MMSVQYKLKTRIKSLRECIQRVDVLYVVLLRDGLFLWLSNLMFSRANYNSTLILVGNLSNCM